MHLQYTTSPQLADSHDPQRLRHAPAHADPRRFHAHTGGEMELLTTVGEQVGCLLELCRAGDRGAGYVELALPARALDPVRN